MSLLIQDSKIPLAQPGWKTTAPPGRPRFSPGPALLLAVLIAFVGLGWVTSSTAADACSYDLTPASRSHGYGATTGKVTVGTSSSCGWVVINNHDWLTVLDGASGTGNGELTYKVAANPTPALRTGALYVRSLDGTVAESFTVTQAGVDCAFSISPSSKDKCSSSMTGSVQVTTKSICSWTVVNPNDWILITGGQSGTGGGKVFYTILGNPSTQPRTGVVLIGNQPFTVRQAGLPYGCPGDKTVECGTAWSFDSPEQIISGNVGLRELYTVTNVICGPSFTATRTWEVTDACGDQALCQQTVTVTTRPVAMNCPPTVDVANIATIPLRPRTLDEFRAAGGQVTFGCDSGTLSYLCVDGPIIGNGCRATLTRTHTVTDSCSAPVSCAQTINISGGATGLAALDDTIAATKNSTLTVPAASLLSNDSNPAGGTLTIIAVSAASSQGGTVALAGSNITYFPPGNFVGTDAFIYTALNDCGETATATVTIMVGENNRPPTANDDTVTTAQNAPLDMAASVLLANDLDPDGDILTVVAVSAGTTQGGSLQLSSGRVLYTPASNFVGADTFTYTADDGHGGRATALVTVVVGATGPQVNHSPTVGNTTVRTTVNIPITVTRANLLALAADPDGDSLTVVSAQASGSVGGILFTAGNVVATPGLNYLGSFDFTFVVSDGRGAFGTGTVTVVVQTMPFDISAETPLFNPQTGLFEQRVSVVNEGGLTIPALSLAITGLPGNVHVWNATGVAGGAPCLQYNFPLDPGQSATVRIEYYSSDRQAFTPIITASPVLPVAAAAASGAGSTAIDRCYMDTRIGTEPRFVIEFTSIPGRVYTMLYSDDATTWVAATPTITATANRTQWYDDGPPKTQSKPSVKGTRFYRVLLAP